MEVDGGGSEEEMECSWRYWKEGGRCREKKGGGGWRMDRGRSEGRMEEVGPRRKEESGQGWWKEERGERKDGGGRRRMGREEGSAG